MFEVSADRVVIQAESAEDLQRGLDAVGGWGRKWGVHSSGVLNILTGGAFLWIQKFFRTFKWFFCFSGMDFFGCKKSFLRDIKSCLVICS